MRALVTRLGLATTFVAAVRHSSRTSETVSIGSAWRPIWATRSAVIAAGALAGATLVSAAAAWAQPYERVHGPEGTSDRAASGTLAVEHCPGGGHVAVGTVGTQEPKIYLVRVAPSGVTAWERTYRIDGSTADTGESVVEASDGSGFVVAGTTRSASSYDAYLLKVNCLGEPLGADHVYPFGTVRIYSTPANEGALDIVEARTGDPSVGTRPGDLVVSGYATDPATGHRTAMLFRVSGLSGALIWSRRYALPTSILSSVAEASPVLPATVGDIVAVGSHVPPGTAASRGYVMRVDGDSGSFTGAANQRACEYPTTGGAQFQAVVPLAKFPHAGDLVMVGSLSFGTSGNDVYAVATSANPCSPRTARRIGGSPGDDVWREIGYDVQEVQVGLPLAPTGTLALTGSAGNDHGTDAFLLALDPETLEPLPTGFSHLFGNHAGGRELGRSLALTPQHVLIAGATHTDFAGELDPADAYLVRADAATGRTACAIGWAPTHARTDPVHFQVQPPSGPFLPPAVRRGVWPGRLDTARPACR